MENTGHDEIRSAVRNNYAKVAVKGHSTGCCAPSPDRLEEVSLQLGYSSEEQAGIPDGANMGLGCGNPQTLAALKEGETVLDLGAGGGFDAFLAARRVGETGRVIGVDMTPEMVSKARKNVAELGLQNVEFLLGEIEHLPVADASVDVIISNCVVNLSPDKAAVFAEAFRILKPGGRVAISDIVALREIPEEMKKDFQLISNCVSGAALVDDLKAAIRGAGFTDVEVLPKIEESKAVIAEWAPGIPAADYVASADIRARKPAPRSGCC